MKKLLLKNITLIDIAYLIVHTWELYELQELCTSRKHFVHMRTYGHYSYDKYNLLFLRILICVTHPNDTQNFFR